MRTIILLAAALPAIALGAVTSVSGASALVTGRPFVLAPRAANLAEAAANRDIADVVARLSFGEDPNRPGLVHNPQQFAQPVVLTPLEGAVLAQHTPLVRLLINRGARVTGRALTRVRCFAEHRGGHGRVGNADTIEYLATLGPSPLNCDGVPIPAI
jgi:hypothetical protein